MGIGSELFERVHSPGSDVGTADWHSDREPNDGNADEALLSGWRLSPADGRAPVISSSTGRSS